MAKQRHSSSGSASSTKDNGPLFSPNPKPRTPNSPRGAADYANGDRMCQATGTRITISSCTIQNYRDPAKCAGCTYEVAT